MNIQSLTLEQFRNYEHERFAFDPGVNLICGENGQGKTNLLEAVAACSTMRLFRTAQKKEGLRFGADHAFIQAEFTAQGRDFAFAAQRPWKSTKTACARNARRTCRACSKPCCSARRT